MKRKKSLLGIALLALALTGCTGGSGTSTDTAYDSTASVSTNSSMFTEEDVTNTTDDITGTITLNGDSITGCTGATVSGTTVTVTSKGTYEVTGTLNDGTIAVNNTNDGDITLILNNVSITSSDYAGIYFVQGEKLNIYLVGDNTVTNTSSFASKDENTVDGAIFAKDDMAIKGDGSLTVSSSKHGIVAKDDLKIMSGTIDVTAENHAIDANNSVRIADGDITLTAGKDGIHVEEEDTTKGYLYMEGGTVTATVQGDGIDCSGYATLVGGTLDLTTGTGSGGSASTTDSYKGLKAAGDISLGDVTGTFSTSDDAIHSNSDILISDGTYTIASGDDGIHADTSLTINGGTIKITKSYEGIESQDIAVNGGDIDVVSSDDGFNAAGGNDSSSVSGRPGQNSFTEDSSGSLAITGGTIHVNATGDGLDANGTLSVSGGTTFVEGPTSSGNGALDYTTSASVTGGTLVAIGSTGMAQNFSTATQGSALISVSGSSGTTITAEDTSGNTLLSFTASKSFACAVVTCPDFEKGGTYTINSTSVTFTTYIISSISGSTGGGGMTPGGGGPGGR